MFVSPEAPVAIVVQKYGGSSVADIERIRKVAKNVVATAAQGNQVVVVVSAMGKTTDVLMEMARQVSANPQTRELDMLLTSGERISMALLSIAIHDLGREAISFTGSQSGIITNDSHMNARIVEVRPFRIQDELERGRIVIVAGYQGVSYRREITTLGRGGSDTTAVALAAALQAERCEIYSDVDGVYTADPNVVAPAVKLDEISVDEMMALSKAGAKVLCAEALEWARRSGIAIYAKATAEPEKAGTIIRLDRKPEDRRISGVTGSKNIILVQFKGATEMPSAEELFHCLNSIGEEQVMPFMSHLSLSGHLGASFLFNAIQFANPGEFVRAVETRYGDKVKVSSTIGTVTLVGTGIAEDRQIHGAITGFLREHASLIHQVFYSPMAVTMLVEKPEVDHLVRDVHQLFLENSRSDFETMPA
jgi:aspartate kinase